MAEANANIPVENSSPSATSSAPTTTPAVETTPQTPVSPTAQPNGICSLKTGNHSLIVYFNCYHFACLH